MRVLRRFLFALLACMPLIAAGAAGQDDSHDYRLGPGDTIRIQVFQSPDLTLDTRVGEDGGITFPLIGAVAIGNLTLDQAGRAIGQKLADGKFLVDPQVTITLVQNRSSQVSVLGQVKQPGSFPLESYGTRLSQVLAIAGGITPTGADTVILTGTRDGKRFRSEIDVSGMFLGKTPDEDVRIGGGDVIFVPPAPMFYIYGEVQRPGSYRRERTTSVRQALALGGGLTPRGTERGIRIQRRGSDGSTREIRPGLNDIVQAEDIIKVQESLF